MPQGLHVRLGITLHRVWARYSLQVQIPSDVLSQRWQDKPHVLLTQGSAYLDTLESEACLLGMPHTRWPWLYFSTVRSADEGSQVWSSQLFCGHLYMDL